MDRVIAAAVADARALTDGGMDALLIENHGDAPFTPGRVEPATVAALTVVAHEVRRAVSGVPLGINVLKNDARAALAVACAVGARFIRVNVHAGAVVADQGLVQSDAHGTLREDMDPLFRSSSWQSVFEGMGIQPRGYCPRVDNLDYSSIASTLRTAKAAIHGMVTHLPTHEEFLRAQNSTV